MKSMDADTRFRAFVAVVVVVLVVGMVYVIATTGFGADTGWTLVSVLILVIMALVALATVRKERKELREGYPKYDERSWAIRMRAGYLAFFISLFFLFGMSFLLAVLEEEFAASLPTSEWLMILVAVMGSIFLVVKARLDRTGAAR